MLVIFNLCSEHKDEEKIPVAVGIAYSVFAQNRHPRAIVTANSGIRVTHDDCFVACTDGVQYIRQLLIQSILCCFGMLHCWCICVDDYVNTGSCLSTTEASLRDQSVLSVIQ